MATKHIGFSGLTSKLKKQGYSGKVAGAIAASAARNASPAAKKANPRLKRVSGA